MSSPVQNIVGGYTTSTGISTHVLEHIAIPIFDSKNVTHRSLSELSQACHAATAKGDTKEVAAREAEVDKAAAKLWGITDDELRAIQEALAETGKSKRAKKESADDSE